MDAAPYVADKPAVTIADVASMALDVRRSDLDKAK
jgi:hypothetical protein